LTGETYEASVNAHANNNKTKHRASEYKHVLANISRSRYVAIATQPVHRLQIRPILHN